MKRRSGLFWFELLIGILLIVLGILAFTKPTLVLTGMVFLYGIVAVVMGVMDLVLYIRVERYTGLGPVISLISGIVSVMSGVMLLVYPRTGALALTVLFPLWYISHCISRLFRLHHLRPLYSGWVYTIALVLNIIGLILGLLMLMSPLFTLATIRCFSGVYLVLLGVDSILMAVSRAAMWY